MIVDNFNVERFSVLPDEADPVPVVDANAVLAGPIFAEGFEL